MSNKKWKSGEKIVAFSEYLNFIWLVAAQSLGKCFSSLTENIHVYVAMHVNMHVNEHVHKKKNTTYLYQCFYDHEAWCQNSAA